MNKTLGESGFFQTVFYYILIPQFLKFIHKQLLKLINNSGYIIN